MTRMLVLIGAALLVTSLVPLAGASDSVASQMLEVVSSFLKSLDSSERTQASFKFEDEERGNWHYVPRERKGFSIGQMTSAQKKLAHALLSTALSNQGLQQANQIMFLENVLYELEGQNPVRDPDAYFVSIFGQPSADSVWGWRFEGHHLSLNLTIQHGVVTSTTPAFFGANPAVVREGDHSGLQILRSEEELARKLLGSLDSGQKRRAVIDEHAPADIITAASRRVTIDAPTGLALQEMNTEQRRLLMQLITVYAERFRPELANEVLAGITESQLEKLHFAWSGGMNPREPHYYRIQSGGFLIEYDNTQNNANHVHTVWRDIRNDFGDDLLNEHYRQAHRSKQ